MHWEYKKIHSKVRDFAREPSAILKQLNELGKERWEVVGLACGIAHDANAMGYGGGPTEMLILLKRPIS